MRQGQTGDPPDEVLQKMTAILVNVGMQLRQSIQKGNMEGCNKDAFTANAKALIDSSGLPEEVMQGLSADGDDWNYDKGMKIPVFPKKTASIILQLRDAGKNLEAAVIMTVHGSSRVIAGNKKESGFMKTNNSIK